MAKKPEKPLTKILLTKSKLQLYIRFGDHALDDQTPQEFAADVLECMDYLMDFRNIVNSMVTFDEPPKVAVIPYAEEARGEAK